MDAAVVELNSLSDPVGPAPQDDDLFLVRLPGLVFPLVGRIVIGGVGGKFRSTGIDGLVHGEDPHLLPPCPDSHFIAPCHGRDLTVGEPELFRLQHQRGVKGSCVSYLGFAIDNLPDIVQKPGIHKRDRMQLLDCETKLQRVAQTEDAVRTGPAESSADLLAPSGLFRLCQRGRIKLVLPVGPQARPPLLKRTEGFLERLLERPTERHRLTDGFHLYAQRRVHPFEFLEVPAGDLHHTIVDRGLERRGGQLRNVVGYLVQRVADRQLRRDLCDRKPGRLRRERRGPRDTRVHLDHEASACPGIDRELNVRPPRFHADRTDDPDGIITHRLVFLVRQGLSGSHRHRVARVDPHGVEILDGADDDDIVPDIPHDLKLVFLPADDGLFEQDLMDGACLEPVRERLLELVRRPCDPSAGPPHGERGAYDDRKTDRRCERDPLIHGPDEPAARRLQPRLVHRRLEELPVLGLPDRVQLRSDQLDAVLLKNSVFRKGHGRVERSLSPHRREQGVRALTLDDLLDEIRCNRFDVRPVREVRIGHDRRRIAVDEDGTKTLFAQDFAGLCAGVVEFAGLTDHDRSGSNNQNGV